MSFPFPAVRPPLDLRRLHEVETLKSAAKGDQLRKARRFVMVFVMMSVPLGLASEGLARPVGGCPTDEWILDATPAGGAGFQSADGNGDGLSCFLEAPEGGGIFTIIDNRVVRP